MMKLKKISVIGMGLLGSSVTLSAKSGFSDVKIVGYSHRASTRDKARRHEVAHEIEDSLERAVMEADIVILATPIRTFEGYFRQIGPHLQDDCIVTDVGSTKTLPHQWAQKHLPKRVYYVGSHPIAGSEKRGLEFARDDLLVNADCILTKVRNTNPAGIEVLKRFWTTLKCKVQVMSPSRHDRIFGMVSHLPHLTAAALVNASREQEMHFAGRGFIDTTRVASGPANIWTDILMTNPETCSQGIENLIVQLKKIQAAIEAGDDKKVQRLLEQAVKKRTALIEYKIDQKELF
jgi:prephenate dehydrogenase